MAEFVQTTLMDGYAGGPHITEAQLGLAHQAAFGPDDYVLEGGRESEAQVLTNNSIRIFDAVYCIQGRRDVIPASGYTDVTIDNGTQGMNRNDIIVRRYKKDEVSEEESTEYAVIKGTPSSGEAVDPSVTTGDIRSGAILHEMKLYRVKLTGLNIVEVEPLFNILKNQATLQKEIAQSNKDLSNKLTELNGKINHNSNKHILIGKWNSAWNLSDTAKNIGSKKAAVDNEYYKTTTGADSTVTVKKSGLYYVSMYAQGSAASGASASIQAQVVASATVVDDAYVLFGAGYSYNGLSANINIGRVVFLQAGTVLTPQLKKSSASGAASTTGSSYMEVVKLA